MVDILNIIVKRENWHEQKPFLLFQATQQVVVVLAMEAVVVVVQAFKLLVLGMTPSITLQCMAQLEDMDITMVCIYCWASSLD